MKRIIPLFLIVITVASCSSVMLTGRRQLNLVSDTELNAMSFSAYEQLIDSVPLSRNRTNTAMVKRVGTRISNAVETYMKNNGYESQIADFKWEYNLIDGKQINAFCMPGGKVAVYTGILPITQNETGLAVVVGHEIAHAIARHSGERLSQNMLAKYGGAIIGAAFSDKSIAIQQGIGTLYGIGSKLTILSYSRKQELEADELGLIFMAMAGYDPRAAIPFWQRMESMAQGTSKPIEFFSTHPSDNRRIADIQKALPKALKYYNR